ncbi:MAG: acyl--CoA ligase [Myxococcales bacterium]|nr:acyl--CoA ligase [Myxococcales bacterium]
MKSLAHWIHAHAEASPDAVAFYCEGEAYSWSRYARDSDRLAAHLLASGFAAGERLAVLLPDGPGVHAAYVACEKAGLVAVGIGPRAGAAEVRHLIQRTRAAGLLSHSHHRDLNLAQLAEALRADGGPLRRHLVVSDPGAGDEGLHVDGETISDMEVKPSLSTAQALEPDAPFLLNSTSGTTGLPKCVVHDQQRWFHFHELAVEAGRLTPSDVFLSALPAPFGFGIWTAHVTPTLLGAPCVLVPNFDAAELLRTLETQRVTVLAAVSTQFIMMLDSPACKTADLSSLRVLFTGGEAVPYERAAEFEERTGASVLQFYGSNETGALSRTTLADAREVRLRTAGHVIEAMQVRLYDESGRDVTASGQGQAACRGPLLSQGYYEDDAANAELYTDDGWMLTGDIASIDADGILRVTGRSADFIIRGGKNISAAVVEAAVSSHPSVSLAAAVAMPDPVFGERVCVYAELRPGTSLDLAELLAHLRQRGTSVESLPEQLIVLQELPRASGGKVAKQALREDIAKRLEAPGRDPS